MSSSLTRTLPSSFSEKSLGESAINGATLGGSSVNGAIRKFNSRLTTIKNKIPRSSLLRKGTVLGQKRASELELDNAEQLSSLLVMANKDRQPLIEIDMSFESDFDESLL